MTIFSNEGYVFRRKSDRAIVGESVELGYIYYLGEEKLESPILETPEDYEEIPKQLNYESEE